MEALMEIEKTTGIEQIQVQEEEKKGNWRNSNSY